MLPIEVRAYLAELMERTYTRTQLELLAEKFGATGLGRNKLLLAKDILSKISEEKEKELIQKVILDARKLDAMKEIEESLNEFERILESALFLRIDESGNIVPIVEPSIKPDFEKEKGYLEQMMKKYGFQLANSHFRQALETYKTSYPGFVALFRNSLQALIGEMIEQKGEQSSPVFTDNITKLVKVGILKRTEKGEEVKAVQSLFGMLSHYGSHPEYVTDEIAQLLYVWTISTLSFLIKRFEKVSEE
jgi:hypothetical protein